MKTTMRSYIKPILAIAMSAGLSSACTEKSSPENIDIHLNQVRALVANEGQFSQGTASLSVITKLNEVHSDVFSKLNDRPLGDVAQAIMVIHDKVYVTLNNSCKVEVMDANFRSIKTMICAEGTIPGYMVYLGGDSIAVSDKNMNGRLMIMDVNAEEGNKAVRRTIQTGTTMQMLLSQGKLYMGGSTLRVLQLGAMNQQQMKTIKNSKGEDLAIAGDSKLVQDNQGYIWMLNKDYLYCIDPKTDEVIKALPVAPLEVGEWDGRLDISPDKKQLYFTASTTSTADNKKLTGIASVGVAQTAVSEELLIDLTNQVKVIYNMAVSPEGTLFVCDAEYGVPVRSNVYEFTLDGVKINTFTAGIMPQYLYFNQQ